MRNSGIVVDAAANREACIGIKRDRVRLGGEADLLKLPFTRQLEQDLQHGPADPASSPGWQDGHAAYAAIRKHAGATYGAMLVIKREHVYSAVVQPIPFQVLGDKLFLDEYLATDIRQRATGLFPGDELYDHWLCWSISRSC